jgi:Helix-turn-helix domain
VTYPLVTRTDRAPQPTRKTTYASDVDIKTEIRDFLTSRRARITPEDVGITSFGQRRVPGLRREEVATLAGLSIEYYNRLERGNLGGASETVLDALADALRLDVLPRDVMDTADGWLAAE